MCKHQNIYQYACITPPVAPTSPIHLKLNRFFFFFHFIFPSSSPSTSLSSEMYFIIPFLQLFFLCCSLVGSFWRHPRLTVFCFSCLQFALTHTNSHTYTRSQPELDIILKTLLFVIKVLLLYTYHIISSYNKHKDAIHHYNTVYRFATRRAFFFFYFISIYIFIFKFKYSIHILCVPSLE